MTVNKQALFIAALGNLVISLLFVLFAMVMTNSLIIIFAVAALAFLALFAVDFYRPNARPASRLQAAIMLIMNLAGIAALYFITLPKDQIPTYAILAVGILAIDTVSILALALYAQPFNTTEKDKYHV